MTGTTVSRRAPAPRTRRVPFTRVARCFFRTPKGLMTLVLFLLLALAAPRAGLALVVPGLVAAVASATLLDGILLWLTRGEWELPSGALLSALFVVLVLDPHTPWYIVAGTAVLAINSKYICRTRWANILNPAAIALVANYFLFGSGQSWWGALPDLPAAFMAVLLAAIVFIAGRINKLPMVVAFLGAYFALFTAAAFLGDAAHVAELFFAGFMLTDPPTSPPRHRDQIVYGIIVAVASATLYLTLGALWFLPGGLLVGNVWEAGRRVFAGRRLERARRAGQAGTNDAQSIPK